MRLIENVGAFFIRNYWLFWILLWTSVFVFVMYVMPRTVTLNEKEWECINPVPKGIESFCTGYVYKGRVIKGIQ